MYPLISVLMATYNPNLIWLKEQIESINNQTYENIEVIILDDCSEYSNYKKIEELAKSLITKFSLKIFRNENNIGSNKTFEKLSLLSKGKYLSYCDQDDIWVKDKLSLLYQKIKKNKDTLLVYSDMKIIDDTNNVISESMSKYRKRHKFFYGKDKYKEFIYRNCVVGCTMLVDRDIVIKSIPFLNSMVHDHYIALFSSCFGYIDFINKPLIFYRQHNKNQTGVLEGVNNKKTYEKYQIDPFIERIEGLKKNKYLKNNTYVKKELCKAKKWGYNRKIWWNSFDFKAFYSVFKLRNCDIGKTFFEIYFAKTPNFIFNRIILILRNKIKQRE